jgi:hypothetical protein
MIRTNFGIKTDFKIALLYRKGVNEELRILKRKNKLSTILYILKRSL